MVTNSADSRRSGALSFIHQGQSKFLTGFRILNQKTFSLLVQDQRCLADIAETMTSTTAALPLTSCIGLNGSVDGGLILTRDGASIIYPLGSTIVVRSLQNEQEQSFLQGHTDQVCCAIYCEKSSITCW